MDQSKLWRILVAATLAVGITGCTNASHEEKEDQKKEEKEDDEKPIALNQTPAPVQASIQKLLGDGKLGKIVREDEDGKSQFEVEYIVKNINHSATISPAGDILEEETEVELSALPAAVANAAKAAYPKGTLKEANTVQAGKDSYYEVEVAVDGKKHVVKVKADGTVIPEKKEK